jgi:hypothetical protein
MTLHEKLAAMEALWGGSGPVLQNLLNLLLGMKRSSMSGVSKLQMETLDLMVGKRPR